MTKKHVSKNTKLSYKRNKRNTHRNTRKHTRRNTRLKQYNIKTQHTGGFWPFDRKKKTVLPVTVASGTETTPPTKAISAWGASGSTSSTSVLSDVSGSTSTTNNFLELTHVWYRIWPDHGVPIMEDFRPFMETLYKNIYKTDSFGFTKDGTDIIIIHCSAGVGRSGVLLIILQLTKFKEDNPNKTIYAQTIIDAINTARINRMHIVQTLEQFKFICEFFYVVPMPIEQKYIDKYNMLDTEPGTTSDEIKYMNKQYNKRYNRYANILPYIKNRVKIINDENDYINASLMNALTINGFTINIILAQGPTQDTLQHFLKMCYEKNVRLIIMLTGLIEKTTNKCDDYMNGDLQTLEIKFNKDTNPVLYTQYTLTHDKSKSPLAYIPTRIHPERVVSIGAYPGFTNTEEPEEKTVPHKPLIIKNLENTRGVRKWEKKQVIKKNSVHEELQYAQNENIYGTLADPKKIFSSQNEKSKQIVKPPKWQI